MGIRNCDDCGNHAGDFSGNTIFELMVPFLLLPLLLWGVSAYGLTVSFLIGELQKLINKLGIDESGDALHKTKA